MKFHQGQEVVCTKKGSWNVIIGVDGSMPGPKFNDVVTVRGYVMPKTFKFLTFEEYPANQGYTEDWFEPIMTIKEVNEAMQEALVER